MAYALTNCRIYTSEKNLDGFTVVIENDKIIGILEEKVLPASIQKIDLLGLCVAPGFIDLQIYGGGGKLFSNEPTVDAIKATYESQKKTGTTSFQITLSSNPLEMIFQSINSARDYVNQGGKGLLGLHLEGPFFNPEKRGAHKPEHIIKPTLEILKEIAEKSKDVSTYMTIAPEMFDNETLSFLLSTPIILSAGHSNITYKQASEVFKKGIKRVTHLFNAMSQFQSREPGLLGATYDHDVWASIIADGVHCDFASVRISKKMMGERLFLITDAVTENTDGDYKFTLSNSNDKYVDQNGILSGSALTMMGTVKNCVSKVGISLEEALRMASTYPAKVAQVGEKLGKVQENYLADLVIFNTELDVKGIVQKGELELF